MALRLSLAATEFGFHPSPNLESLGQELVQYILSGNQAACAQIWPLYQAQAERLIDALTDENDAHSRAQNGLIGAKAIIWHEGDEPVRALAELDDAETYASHMGFEDMASRLRSQLTPWVDQAEYFQARGLYQRAMRSYEQRLQKTGPETGLSRLRLAECCRELLRAPSADRLELGQALRNHLEEAERLLTNDVRLGKVQELRRQLQAEGRLATP